MSVMQEQYDQLHSRHHAASSELEAERVAAAATARALEATQASPPLLRLSPSKRGRGMQGGWGLKAAPPGR